MRAPEHGAGSAPGWALAAASLAALALAAGPAHAEEGLFTLRAAGGVSTVEPDAPRLGGAAVAGWTLGWTDALAVTTTATYVGHPAFDAATLGLGLRLEGALGDWTHPFVLVEPSLLVAFDAPSADPPVLDAAVRAAVGLDYLVLWGLGLTLEVSATLPAGLGRLPAPRAASAAITSGLYAEF